MRPTLNYSRHAPVKWWIIRESHPVLKLKRLEHHVVMLMIRKDFRLSLAAFLFYPMISLGINPASSGSTTISLFDLPLP